MANVTYGKSEPSVWTNTLTVLQQVRMHEETMVSMWTEPKPWKLNSNCGKDEKGASLLASLPLNGGRKLCYKYTCNGS